MTRPTLPVDASVDPPFIASVSLVIREQQCDCARANRQTDVSDLTVSVNALTPVSEPLYAVA